MAKKLTEKEIQAQLENLKIGEPIAGSFTHESHVEADPSSAIGLKGLPKEWEMFLMTSGVSKQEILQNPEVVLSIMNENAKNLLGDTSNLVYTLGALPSTKLGASHLPSKQEVDESQRWDKLVTLNVEVDKVYPDRKKIGEGSTGVVYLTKSAKNPNELLALKVMNIFQEGQEKSPTGIENDMKAIMNEVSVMKVCQSCRQIVHFYDAFMVKETEKTKNDGSNKQLWIAMEYMDGGCLTNIVSLPGSIPDPLTAYVMKEMLLALAFLHKNHRLHRDIKSDNVLVNLDGTIKLSDFGFCAQLTQEVKKRKSIVGTPYWMSPELIQGMEYDELTDIWSLGITAIECADGNPPLMEVPPFRALYLIVTSPPPTIKNPRAHSKELVSFLTCCLQRTPTKRWTAEKLLTHPFLKMAAKKEDLIPYVQKAMQK